VQERGSKEVCRSIEAEIERGRELGRPRTPGQVSFEDGVGERERTVQARIRGHQQESKRGAVEGG